MSGMRGTGVLAEVALLDHAVLQRDGVAGQAGGQPISAAPWICVFDRQRVDGQVAVHAGGHVCSLGVPF
jgi:hypothetical protein